MKKTVSIMLCLLLIFSSVSFAFADFGASDSSNLSNLTTYTNTIKNALTASNGAIYSTLNYISNRLLYGNKTAANWLSDIENHLATTLYQNDGNASRSIAWWVKEAVLDLDQLVGSGNGTVLNYLDNIYQRLVDIKNSTANIYSESHTIRTNIADLMENYMPAIRNAVTLYLPSIKTDTGNIDSVISSTISNRSFMYWSDTGNSNWNLSNYGMSGNIAWTIPEGIRYLNYNTVYGINKILRSGFNNFNATNTALNWTTLQNQTFNPTSAIHGLYYWLTYIQNPIARLAYVHASDEEIAARQKAAANQDAVVNNFIDSTGSGAAPASSFGSVASMSSGYTSNMNTDAQASGIWNIFNSNNFGWFSQETANQLDTTTASTRKGYSEFETPLLDQQIEEIYKELGVDVND